GARSLPLGAMPIRNWKPALNRFMIEFDGRLIDYL
ncbi:MAG: putative transposase, partial [Cryomorphaceae bacterium]